MSYGRYDTSPRLDYIPEHYPSTSTGQPQPANQQLPSPPMQQFSPYSMPSSSFGLPEAAPCWAPQPAPHHAFDPREHTSPPPATFDPARFSSQFVAPRFAQGFQNGPFGDGPTVVDQLEALTRPGMPGTQASSYDSSSFGGTSSSAEDDSFRGSSSSSGTSASRSSASPKSFMGPPPIPTFSSSASAALFPPRSSQPPPARAFQGGVTDPLSAVYDLYGSSVISLQPTFDALKLAPRRDPARYSGVPSEPSDPFDPAALGLPLPPASGSGEKNYRGLYSTSGLDMIGILARVAARPNPEIEVGPVDLGCSFLVTDARKFDHPIVYASDTFSRLTGYSNQEIIGKNCRFLQSPDGIVEQGEKRRYTDGNAVHHLKRHISTGRETQASLINYAKGGKPFINLVTCIPISWDSDEIAYYVGFQVDLVDQPSAILEKMKNGTYVVNYSVGTAPSMPRSNPSVAAHDDEVDLDEPALFQPARPAQSTVMPAEAPMDVDSNGNLLDSVLSEGVAALANDGKRKQFNRLLLEHCDDFIHVVSLKGSLLYVSPSAARLLEYHPSELAGTLLSSICHPSDIVAVLRELKEAGAPGHPGVNVLYRLRRKHSGYVWLEASGKLFHEQAKGRKCVILVGRPREVLQVSWSELEKAGGLAEKEYWSKLSFDGMQLHTTPLVKDVLGYSSEELVGTNISTLDVNGVLLAALRELSTAPTQEVKTVRHQMKGREGLLDVVTNLYPSGALHDDVAGPRKARSSTIIAQTSCVPPEGSVRPIASLPTPVDRSRSSSITSLSSRHSGGSGAPLSLPVAAFRGRASDGESSSGSSNSSFSAIPSTFKTLTQASSDNIFDELETTRGTSWQFELHQLRITNKKLREEKDALAALQRKKRKRAVHPGDIEPSLAKPSGPRACANCGRTSSAEWRSGPTGPKSLCNACGLRWSKARPSPGSAGSGSDSAGSGGASANPSPSSSAEDLHASNAFRNASIVHQPSSLSLHSYSPGAYGALG